jgi:hypothetical protein
VKLLRLARPAPDRRAHRRFESQDSVRFKKTFGALRRTRRKNKS